MKKNNDDNVETITRSGELTPLEQLMLDRQKQAHFVHLLMETKTIIDGYDKLDDIVMTLDMDRNALEEVTDKALATLAQEMQDIHGISA